MKWSYMYFTSQQFTACFKKKKSKQSIIKKKNLVSKEFLHFLAYRCCFDLTSAHITHSQ